MDSNAAHFSREDDKDCHLVPAAAAEEPSRPPGSGPQAASGEAAPGCQSNTQGHSSHSQTIPGFPDYLISGGCDWFEWSGLIDWSASTNFNSMINRFVEAKLQCQQLRKPYVEVFVPDFGSVRVSRFGMNRGGERGQHFEFRLSIAGATIGLSPRNVDRREVGNRKHPSPNICLKQTGRGCLLVGAVEANERAEAFISVLGGEPIELKISRGDLCLDIVNLSAFELHDLAREGHFITDASHVRPAIDYLTNEVTGFYAGKAPLYLTVYDKVAERMGKVDQLYNRALIDRRWHGHIPRIAARIEYQLRRPWLLDKGISTPRDFLERRGSLGDTLTKDWFRITQRKVDRRNKHQSRAKTHPLWIGIQQAFEIIFGPSEGFLPPIKRNKITPIELAAQARGCITACLLQMGVEVRNYKDFARKSGQLMLRLFPKDEERLKFLQEFDRRKMEFETS